MSNLIEGKQFPCCRTKAYRSPDAKYTLLAPPSAGSTTPSGARFDWESETLPKDGQVVLSRSVLSPKVNKVVQRGRKRGRVRELRGDNANEGTRKKTPEVGIQTGEGDKESRTGDGEKGWRESPRTNI